MEVFLGKQNKIFVYLQVFDKGPSKHPNTVFVCFYQNVCKWKYVSQQKNIRKFKKFSEQRLKQIQNKSPKCNVV